MYNDYNRLRIIPKAQLREIVELKRKPNNIILKRSKYPSELKQLAHII